MCPQNLQATVHTFLLRNVTNFKDIIYYNLHNVQFHSEGPREDTLCRIYIVFTQTVVNDQTLAKYIHC